MVGLFLGILCGASELWLLYLLIDGVTKGRLRAWVVLAKMAVLAVFLVPCAIWWADQLVVAGVATAGFLMIGSVFIALIFKRSHTKGKLANPNAEEDAR